MRDVATPSLHGDMIFYSSRSARFRFRKYSSSQNALDYCIRLVKKHDYDHYLCTLLLPKRVQPSVFTLRAFNVEIAQIKDSVTKADIGKMRIQFWRERINSIYNEGETAVKHPVGIMLHQTIKECNLNKMWFSRVLDAREKDLTTSVFYTTSSFEDYSEYTNSSLLYLTLQTLGINDVSADHAASHIGKAEGIVNMLRATQYYRHHRKILMPMDILSRHGATQEDFIRGKLTKSVEDSVYDCASLADAHLKKAKACQEDIPAVAVKAFLPAVVLRLFLDRLEGLGFDIFNSKITTRDNLLPVKLLWRKQL